MARINRLNRIQDPSAFNDQVASAAREFFNEYKAFRKSRYARGFKKWMPLYVGGLLTAAATVVAPHVALGIAGASLTTQVIQKRLEVPTIPADREHIFDMLAGMRKDIIRRTGVSEVI